MINPCSLVRGKRGRQHALKLKATIVLYNFIINSKRFEYLFFKANDFISKTSDKSTYVIYSFPKVTQTVETRSKK